MCHHHALLLLARTRFGREDFSTYPDVTSPTAPLCLPRWDGYGVPLPNSVQSGVLVVQAQHNSFPGLRYATQAATGGKYVRVLLDHYPGIPDEERRLLFDVNSVFNGAVVPGLFYFSADTVQVALFTLNTGGVIIGVAELTARPNAQLQISSTEPTYLELFVPTSASGKLEARTWGQSKPRPAAPGYSEKLSTLISQYGPISLAGQLVLRSINGNTARVRKIAILTTP